MGTGLTVLIPGEFVHKAEVAEGPSGLQGLIQQRWCREGQCALHKGHGVRPVPLLHFLTQKIVA